MTEHPQLAYLAQAYFHQDYDLDGPTPAGIIASYIANEPPAAIRQLATEIRMMLEAGMTDSQIGHLWITTWHASYEPSKDGFSYRDWLTATLTALENGTRTRQVEPASDPEPPEPWFRPDPQHGAKLAAQARAEIGADHELQIELPGSVSG